MNEEYFNHIFNEMNYDKDLLNLTLDLDEYFLFIKPEQEAIDLIKKYKKSYNEKIELNKCKFSSLDYLTLYELIKRAKISNESNLFNFLKKYVIVIPKTQNFYDYLNTVKTINILSNDKAKCFTSKKIKLFANYQRTMFEIQFYKQIIENFDVIKCADIKFLNEGVEIWFTLNFHSAPSVDVIEKNYSLIQNRIFELANYLHIKNPNLINALDFKNKYKLKYYVNNIVYMELIVDHYTNLHVLKFFIYYPLNDFYRIVLKSL